MIIELKLKSILYSFINYNSKKYFKNILIQGSGNLFAQIVGILLLPILTRLYSPNSFGLLSQFSNLVAFLTILITFRLEYFVLVPKKVKSSVNLFLEIIKLGFFLTLFFTALFVSIFYFDFLNLSNHLPNFSFVFVPIAAYFISISIASQQILQKMELYKISSFSESVNKSIFFLFGLILFKVDYKISGLILATLLGYLGRNFFLIYSIKILKFRFFKFGNFFFKNILTFKKEALSFSVSNLIQTLTGFIPIIFISDFYGLSILGQWSLAISVVYLPSSVIGSAIGQVFYQKANQLKNDGLSFDSLWLETVKVLILICIPTYIFVAIFSPFLFPFVFGSKWQDSGIYASILSISIGLSMLSTPFDRTCFIVNKLKYPYVINTVRLFFSVLVVLVSISLKFSFVHFLVFQSIVMASLYSIDLYMSFYFSKLDKIILKNSN